MPEPVPVEVGCGNETWKSGRARKKLLGVIPYWAICLLVLGLVIVGLVMGTVLGVLLTDGDDKKKKPDGDE